MYITKEELEARLKKTSLQIVERERKTRGSEKRLTHDDRVMIGILSEVDTNKNIADLVGVSAQTVSNVSRGLTSPTIGVDKELKEEVAEGIEAITKSRLETEKQIQDQLITNLASALGQVANNLHNTDSVEAAKVAVDMSKILERVSTPKEHRGNRTAVIINMPNMKEEKSYSTITV